MELKPVTHTITSAWHVDKESKTIVVESSDAVGPLRDGRPLYSRLYDDACDVGCETFNPRTGHGVRWFMVEEVVEDGDLQVTIFKPCTESVRRHPPLEGWELHILND